VRNRIANIWKEAMSFLKKLFGLGSGAAQAPANDVPPEIYKGYTIQPSPAEENGAFQICGLISREVDGVLKEQHFIRADRLPSRDIAVEMTVSKARQMIDLEGDRIFRNS
jgi:hypothetical protein